MMRSWKVVASLLGFWLLVLLYMSVTMLHVEPDATTQLKSENQLRRALDELDVLKVQNRELRSLATDLRSLQDGPVKENLKDRITRLEKQLQKAHSIIQRFQQMNEFSRTGRKEWNKNEPDINPDHNHTIPTKEHEIARRRVENNAFEFWFYLSSQLDKSMKLTSGNTELKENLAKIFNNANNYQRTILTDLNSLASVNGGADWRLNESLDLGAIVQKRLHYLQNPKDCNSAKKLVCNLGKGCGYGCQLHHVSFCLILAYATERTLILESKGWRYANQGWESIFLPLSQTCTSKLSERAHHWTDSEQMKDLQVVDLTIIDSLHPKPQFLPPAIPEDLAPRLVRLHGNPIVWWVGQIERYLCRQQPHLQDDIKKNEKRLGFKNPIVGVQVRRTDKVGTEASFHSIDEYMKFVDEFYDTLERRQRVDKRRVYLASDDTAVLNEARKSYPHYDFISDNEISQTAGLGSRYSDSSLRGIVIDIHFLSRCDYLVCTFSSQVCRVAYELMQTYHGDASQMYHSLDDIYYYGGQNAHNVLVREAHSIQDKDQIAILPGDLIGIAGNHWDGYSKGLNRRTGQMGIFPSYKTEDVIRIERFPTYAEADRAR